MKIAAAVAADSLQLVGLGRAPRIALGTVVDDVLTDSTVLDVHWDELHGDHECHHDGQDDKAGHAHASHGSHHARIVTFLRENEVDAVLAAHAGPPMVNTIMKMGLAFLAGQGDADELFVPAAKAVAEGAVAEA